MMWYEPCKNLGSGRVVEFEALVQAEADVLAEEAREDAELEAEGRAAVAEQMDCE